MARKKKKVEAAIDQSIEPSIAADVSEIGKTSNELSVENSADHSAASESSSRFSGMIKDFTVFDAFLLISLICITVATLRVFFAMAQYGGYFWDKPWNVTQ